jgi:hypothetical protein
MADRFLREVQRMHRLRQDIAEMGGPLHVSAMATAMEDEAALPPGPCGALLMPLRASPSKPSKGTF